MVWGFPNKRRSDTRVKSKAATSCSQSTLRTAMSENGKEILVKGGAEDISYTEESSVRRRTRLRPKYLSER
jgi:hypothetical protein